MSPEILRIDEVPVQPDLPDEYLVVACRLSVDPATGRHRRFTLLARKDQRVRVGDLRFRGPTGRVGRAATQEEVCDYLKI